MTTEPEIRHLKEIAKKVAQFSMDHHKNIQLIVEYVGEYLKADAAFYNKLMDGKLVTVSNWNAPAGYVDIDDSEGHLCVDVINEVSEECLVITDLSKTIYNETDPNVRKYNLNTYVGYGVKCKQKVVGSLCIVYRNEKHITDFDKDFISVLGTFIGIEEDRISKEQEALKTTEFLNILIEDSLDMIICSDADRKIVKFNKAARDRYGYSLEEILGKDARILYPHVEDNKRILSSLKSSGMFKGEVDNIDKYGNIFTSMLSASPLYNKHGYYLGTTGISRDITDQKESALALERSEATLKDREAKLNAIVNTAKDAIITIDRKGKIIFWNSSAEHMFGYTAYEAYGRTLDFIIPDRFKKAHINGLNNSSIDMRRTLSSCSVGETVELYGLRKNNEEFPLELSLSCWENKKNMYFTGIIRDISERKVMEYALMRRDRILQAVSFTASRFLNNNFWETDIELILRELGVSTNVSRVYIFKNKQRFNKEVVTSQIFEWCAEEVLSELNNITLKDLPLRAFGFGRWVDKLSNGEIICDFVKDLPTVEKNFLSKQSIKSILIIPIMVEGFWWGFIGFDECCIERQWAAIEIDALKIVADTLSSGIQRDIKKEKEKKEAIKRWDIIEQQVKSQINDVGIFNSDRESKKALFNALTLMNSGSASFKEG